MADVVAIPIILGVLEHLGVWLPLVIVVMGAAPAFQVCSEYRFKLQGICATGGVEVPPFLDPGCPSCFVC